MLSVCGTTSLMKSFRAVQAAASGDSPSPAHGTAVGAGAASVVSLRPRLDRGQISARKCFAAVANAPTGLDAAVDADEEPERFGAMPPAEARAGDDPGVLVEPVALVGCGRAAAGS